MLLTESPRSASVPPLLGDLAVAAAGDALPARICAAHLARLGARREERAGGDPALAGELEVRPTAGGEGVRCTLRWAPPAPGDGPEPRSEPLVQAVSGVMAVHGRDRGRPRRLGLEVASAAAGVIAAQGVLAALIARQRGLAVRGVETSVLQGALILLSHHLAIATSGDPWLRRTADEALRRSPDARPAPPFLTADGHAVELEALTPDVWEAFWTQLGADRAEVQAAWPTYVFRYLSARCLLPRALHRAAAGRTLDDVHAAAAASGAVVRRVRGYPEVLDSLGRGAADPWSIVPGGRREAAAAAPPAGGAPLAGMRVIDVTTRLQGPLAGHLLRLLGAHVVKVERPGGDIGRVAPLKSLHSAYLAYNRGKEVEEVDYKSPQGRERLAELAAGADVCLHNWRPGRAARLGLDSADLARRNPGLVYAYASGWGPESDLIAGDFLVQAYSGCAEGITPEGEPPAPSRMAYVDIMGGLLACEGILAGLYLRERTGRGCRVDTSLLGAATLLQAHVLAGIATGDERGRRMGRPVWGPLDQPVETADGFLLVEAAEPAALRSAAAVCGARADGPPERLQERIATQLRGRTAAEWERRLGEVGVAATAVCADLADVPGDPRMAGLLEEAATGARVPAAPWRFAG
ncbi:MAG TPA: CoA transferase [Longimicrobium sp.]